MKLQKFIDIILGKPAISQRDIFAEARQSLQENERLNTMEKAFITELYTLVQQGASDTDYEILAKNAPSDNIEFWYESAVAMMLSADNGCLDIRPNGRLQTAYVILSKIMEHSNKVAPFWAQKIAVLDYLACGHAKAGKLGSADDYIQQLLDATLQASNHFPDIEWFTDKRQEILSKYGE